MLFLSIVFGALVGYLTDVWLARVTVSDPLRLILAVVVFALVTVFTYTGHLLHF